MCDCACESTRVPVLPCVWLLMCVGGAMHATVDALCGPPWILRPGRACRACQAHIRLIVTVTATVAVNVAVVVTMIVAVTMNVVAIVTTIVNVTKTVR